MTGWTAPKVACIVAGAASFFLTSSPIFLISTQPVCVFVLFAGRLYAAVGSGIGLILLFYGIMHRLKPFIINQIIWFVVDAVVILGIIKYS